ncbi:MAG: alpha/beta hydrolase [Verrucomicrobiaceae bacterium]|nr:alpha/beta hydrolase [Verrucomicrobiaceae bacterium]
MKVWAKIWRIFWRVALAIVLAAALIAGAVGWYLHPSITETRNLVYGQRQGKDLVLHVLKPAHPSGIGVVVMISGRWKSNPEGFSALLVAPFLRQGQTVFAVGHMSQPDASVMDTVEDVNRAVRYVRLHAASYGVDPSRLGVAGGSSGGHLSLMLATQGRAGDPTANNPVDRESSQVQAAAVFFPVTDLINLGPSTENLHDGGPPKSFRNAFGPNGADLTAWPKIGHAMSPIDHITPDLPPIFIVHGDADTLVPVDQSIRFQEQAAKTGRQVELIVRPGKKHGWLTMLWDMRLMAQWFAEKMPPQN